MISVIILSYNSQKFIEDCITSVIKNVSKDTEIIVIDNNSTDSTLEILKKYQNRINLIEAGKNLGFSKSNNLAAKTAQGEYLFFLNPDTKLKAPILLELLNFYKLHPDAGIVCPRLRMPNGAIQPSVRKLPTIWGAVQMVFGNRQAFLEYVPDCNRACEIEAVYGAALLIKTDLFFKVGGFDERYFMYFEDLELCKAIKKMKKKIYYLPNVEVDHLVGGVKSDKKSKFERDSMVIYHGLIKAVILRLLFQIARVKRKLLK